MPLGHALDPPLLDRLIPAFLCGGIPALALGKPLDLFLLGEPEIVEEPLDIESVMGYVGYEVTGFMLKDELGKVRAVEVIRDEPNLALVVDCFDLAVSGVSQASPGFFLQVFWEFIEALSHMNAAGGMILYPFGKLLDLRLDIGPEQAGDLLAVLKLGYPVLESVDGFS